MSRATIAVIRADPWGRPSAPEPDDQPTRLDLAEELALAVAEQHARQVARRRAREQSVQSRRKEKA